MKRYNKFSQYYVINWDIFNQSKELINNLQELPKFKIVRITKFSPHIRYTEGCKYSISPPNELIFGMLREYCSKKDAHFSTP